MWNIFKKIKERKVREEQELLQFKKEFQEAVESIEKKIEVDYNKNRDAIYERKKRLETTCPKCDSKNVVDKINRIKGEINGNSSGGGSLFGWSSYGSLHGSIDTYAVKKCNNCQHEWKTDVSYPNREGLKDKLNYIFYVLDAFNDVKRVKYDKNDLKEKFNSKEEKRLAKENEAKNYWAIPKAKELFGGMKVSIVKQMLYEYASSYYKDKMGEIYDENVLITYVGLIK